jgi:hypothetical protein
LALIALLEHKFYFSQFFHLYLGDVLNNLLKLLLEVVLNIIEAGLEAGPDFLDLILHACFVLLELLSIEHD